MNPCPSGHLGDTRRRCRCTTNELLTYRRRISGPLLDRIDLHVDVPALARSVLGDPGLGATSAEVRSRVERARAAQLRRWGAPGGPPNARLRGAALRRHCAPDPEGKRLLATAIERLGLSARGHDKVLRVARTLADLEGVERVGAAHVAEAIQFRALDRPVP
jgi:magnesium chelatase family protein